MWCQIQTQRAAEHPQTSVMPETAFIFAGRTEKEKEKKESSPSHMEIQKVIWYEVLFFKILA